MKICDTRNGSAWLPSLLAMVVLALFVLLVFGEKPEDMLQIPVAIFNDMKSGSAGRPVGPVPPPSAPVAVAPAHPAGATPVPFDWSALAASPAEWPKAVALKSDTSFPVVVNGSISGNVNVPAGAEVKLVALKNQEVTVDYQGGSKVVPATATDLKQRVLAARAQTGQ